MKLSIVLGLLALAVSAPACAGLGGAPMSAASGVAGAKVMRQSAAAGGYSVEETVAEDGTTVREFVLPSGEVFAVAWSGPRMPNLRQLLGAYFEAYRDEAAARSPGRRPMAIDRPGLVVQSGGHPRAFHGRAYLPERMPEGFSSDDIR